MTWLVAPAEELEPRLSVNTTHRTHSSIICSPLSECPVETPAQSAPRIGRPFVRPDTPDDDDDFDADHARVIDPAAISTLLTPIRHAAPSHHAERNVTHRRQTKSRKDASDEETDFRRYRKIREDSSTPPKRPARVAGGGPKVVAKSANIMMERSANMDVAKVENEGKAGGGTDRAEYGLPAGGLGVSFSEPGRQVGTAVLEDCDTGNSGQTAGTASRGKVSQAKTSTGKDITADKARHAASRGRSVDEDTAIGSSPSRLALTDTNGAEEETIEDGDEVVPGFAEDILLLPHQIKGTKWMKKAEEGPNKGGILADDMGLGKTIQTLARILQTPRTPAQRQAGYGGTLIVVPLAVMKQWADEAEAKTVPGLLKIAMHHGPDRAKLGIDLTDYDIVVTTYGMVAGECPDFPEKTKKDLPYTLHGELLEKYGDELRHAQQVTLRGWTIGALFQIEWLRIVLDEAHTIKNDRTKAAKGATWLAAEHRWCLTGTPIQNSVGDLYSLFRFMRIKPYVQLEEFRKVADAENADGTPDFAKLHAVLRPVLLRRTKTDKIDGRHLVELPKRTVEHVPCLFDQHEQDFYGETELAYRETFNKYVQRGQVKKNMDGIFAMLTRLRQMCLHPNLVTWEEWVGKLPLRKEDEIPYITRMIEAAEAPPIAPDPADELAEKLLDMEVSTGMRCRLCRTIFEEGDVCNFCGDLATGGRDLPDSAKIRTILRLLRDIKQRDGGERTIIFCLFTKFFDLLEPFLFQQGVAFTRYDGSMKQDRRLESLQSIRSGKTSVILISFKAGSTGLNLTCCNNVILSDMWWNPALEEQAFDRAHRLGQTKDVNIYKLVVHGTIEDRILTLQEQKREIAKNALSGQAQAQGKMQLTEADMGKLFGTS